MAKATLSADEFLTAIAGESELYALPGVGTVEIRPLTFAEAQRLSKQHRDDEVGLMMGAIVCGLVTPKLTEDQVARLHDAAVGPVSKLAQRIMSLSGMVDSEQLENLSGGGS